MMRRRACSYEREASFTVMTPSSARSGERGSHHK
jgi:hypothetical protein